MCFEIVHAYEHEHHPFTVAGPEGVRLNPLSARCFYISHEIKFHRIYKKN